MGEGGRRIVVGLHWFELVEEEENGKWKMMSRGGWMKVCGAWLSERCDHFVVGNKNRVWFWEIIWGYLMRCW